jgi:dolichyl-phosphate beta-glucosyltransferase
MMVAEPELSVIIPAYNEAARIVHTLKATESYLAHRGYSFEIIVIADGSDKTRELSQDYAAQSSAFVHVGGTTERRGKGRAIREGVEMSRGEIVGFIDADYKTPIEECEKLLPWLKKGYDLAIGSRALSDSRVEIPQPLYRRLGSKMFAITMHVMTGLWQIHDTQCGFKFFKRSVARALFRRQAVDGYMFDVEILCLARQMGFAIKEVPIAWRDDGDSRLNVATMKQNIIDIFRIRFATSAKMLPAATETVELAAKPTETR